MHRDIRDKIRERIILEHKSLFSRDKFEEKELRIVVHKVLEEIIHLDNIALSASDKKAILDEMINELIGLGPIEVLMQDSEITEIMINGPGKVYIERKGRKELSNITFDSEQQLMYFIHKLLAPTRRRVDESYPFTEISLTGGSRINIIIPPLALDGPSITIRRFSKYISTLDDLIELNTIDRKIGDFLVACIKGKVNIIFSGATGVGKTTTLNVLSSFIKEDERIVTIEDTAELCLKQEHVVRLQTRQPNIEGKGEIGIRALFNNSLRMRPDRIIIGEIRGAEALDMLQGICSGHRGSLAIIHANSPQDVIYRLETVILTSGFPVNLDFIHRQIQAAISLIVHHEQLSDGSRKITRVSQINGLKDGKVILEDIFIYDGKDKSKCKWKATGVIPAFYPLLKEAGIDVSEEIFKEA